MIDHCTGNDTREQELQTCQRLEETRIGEGRILAGQFTRQENP